MFGVCCVGKREVYKEERNMTEKEMMKVDGCDMDKFGMF